MSSTPTTETLIYISYPRTPDLQFNTTYYLTTHMPLVDKHWRPYGLKAWSVVQFPEGDASGLHTQAILRFESREAFERAWEADVREVMGDLGNYSNVVPSRWVGEVVLREG